MQSKDMSLHVINLMALSRLSEEELEKYFGQYAVMHDGLIISYHPTNKSALEEGARKFQPGEFSIQRIERLPADLGSLDCAND